ncbi:hypothetical protein [Streptomyces sp. G45]|uniref:hypothetical protein n=1 Tax=Streptomyces sp. G45 TaxID=3406627 RepID=UPI003C1A4CAA
MDRDELSEDVVELTEEERSALVGEVPDSRVVLGCLVVCAVLLAAVLYAIWGGR